MSPHPFVPNADPPPVDWTAVRRDYETSSKTVIEIRAAYGITPYQLAKHRLAEGWHAREAGPANLMAANVARAAAKLGPVPDADAVHVDTKAAPKGANGSLTHRKALLRRLFVILDLKIRELDTRIATAGAAAGTGKKSLVTGAESERDARMLGHALKTYEQLCDLADATPKATAETAETSETDDVDRVRADLRERIERLARHRGPAPNSDGNPGGAVGA